MEFAKHIAVKSKKQLEADMEDLQKQLEEMTRSKQEVLCDLVLAEFLQYLLVWEFISNEYLHKETSLQ